MADGIMELRREIRDKLSAEIEGMGYEELSKWLTARRYSDPLLQLLADKAAQQRHADGRPLRGRR